MAAPPPEAPGSEHRARRARLAARLARLDRTYRRLSRARLAVFVAALVLAGFTFGPGAIAPYWLVAALAGFGALVVVHERVVRDQQSAAEATRFHDGALARIDGLPVPDASGGDAFADPEHPCALDLDLFGAGSVFEWLCRARTSAGQRRLAGWLLSPAPAPVWRARQQAARELAPRLELRERLWVEAAAAREGVDSAVLEAWATAGPVGLSAGARRLATAGAALGVAVLALALAGVVPGWALAAALAAEAAIAAWLARRVRHVLAGVAGAAAPLASLRGLLAAIERERFEAPRLVELHAGLVSGGAPARSLAALARTLDLLESRRNLLVALPAAVLLWGTHLAIAIERWRVRHGAEVRGWIEVAAELEALASLAAIAHENPGDAWPEPLEGSPRFDAEELGHPLLRGGGVRNRVALGPPALLVVSGSNMAGKSTLLRSVGVAAVLAQAGAPVRAARLRLTPLAVGATLRVQDSLRDGRSRFYAELLRLQRLMAMAGGSPPLLFLLDEILHGTNSHDRRIGAGAVLRRLGGMGAIGIVTTHDLALARLGEQPELGAENAHFEDEVHAGEMSFDYRLRPGPIARGNALALMRSLGLAEDVAAE